MLRDVEGPEVVASTGWNWREQCMVCQRYKPTAGAPIFASANIDVEYLAWLHLSRHLAIFIGLWEQATEWLPLLDPHASSTRGRAPRFPARQLEATQPFWTDRSLCILELLFRGEALGLLLVYGWASCARSQSALILCIAATWSPADSAGSSTAQAGVLISREKASGPFLATSFAGVARWGCNPPLLELAAPTAIFGLTSCCIWAWKFHIFQIKQINFNYFVVVNLNQRRQRNTSVMNFKYFCFVFEFN